MSLPAQRHGAPLVGALLFLLLAVGNQVPVHAEDPPAAPAAHYRIEAGDLLEIRVFGQPELSMQMRVPPEGTVSYPGLRNLELFGRTIGEVEQELVRHLTENGFLKNPLVTVLVKDFAPRSVYVLGRVREPGEYQIPIGRDLLLSHAISMARGFAEDADLATVRVLRTVSGRAQQQTIDFRSIERGRDPGQNIVLRAGDQILVPELRSAYVIGEVNRPGEVSLPAEGGLTVSRVLSLAGGFDVRSADLGEVKIYRRTSTGTRTIEVDVKAHLSGDAREPEPTVEPEDLVYVPRRGIL